MIELDPDAELLPRIACGDQSANQLEIRRMLIKFIPFQNLKVNLAL